MTEFHQIRLGDVLTLQRGFDITKSEQSEGEVPIISSSGISSYHNKCKVKGPGVIIGRKGTLGTVHFIRTNYWPHDTTLWVKDFKENDPKFLNYFLKTLKLENFDVGASNPTLNRNHVHKIKIIFPKRIHTQKQIAAILSAYDDLIENNNRRIALLEKMAEEIYHEWFVRLRFPGHEKVKKVKGVPETWDNTRFGEFCMLKRGYDLPDASVEPGDYPVIASTSIKTYHNEFKTKPPVITTGRSGSLGTVLMVNCKAWPLNTALYVKNFFGNSPYLVFYTLKNMGLEKFNSGAGIPTLNRNHINGIKMAVPDKDLQRQFDSVVAPFHKQKEQLATANVVLTRVREILLPRLISGKLSVENLDIQFPPGMAEEAEAIA
jgi:type I restriction enzyme S subunit